jgi:hypothetical protein
MVRASSLALLAAVVAASPAMSPAMAETMSFENAAGILAESCGKDIDANCAGVNLDAPRLKECLTRNQDSVSAQCRADYIRALDAIQKRGTARIAVGKQCEREKQKMCAEERPSHAWSRCRAAWARDASRRSAMRGIADAASIPNAALPSVAGRRFLDGHLARPACMVAGNGHVRGHGDDSFGP